jgi:hypothetical protein
VFLSTGIYIICSLEPCDEETFRSAFQCQGECFIVGKQKEAPLIVMWQPGKTPTPRDEYVQHLASRLADDSICEWDRVLRGNGNKMQHNASYTCHAIYRNKGL